MIFKDKEVMEKLDQLEEMIKDLKSQVADLTYCMDTIMFEFDIGIAKHVDHEEEVPKIEESTEEPPHEWCGGEEVWERYYRGDVPTTVEVSNYGNVRNAKAKRPVGIYLRNGIPRFNYSWLENGERKTSSVNVCNAIASTFLNKLLPLKCHSVRHIDENPKNNHVDNLVVH